MPPPTLKVLNVAEKPSVAKEITRLLGGNNVRRLKAHYEAIATQMKNVFLAATSVIRTDERVKACAFRCRHLMSLDFPSPFSSWNAVFPEALFTAPVLKRVSDSAKDIVGNLKTYAKKCQWLVLWLDCDREGENIAFEVLQVCKEANRNIQPFRAIFSAVTRQDIERACQHLQQPNEALAQAADARSEVDLRIGAAFTRFLTKRYQNRLSLQKGLISYGPCQFPTLGFVVERYLEVEKFVAENFWTLRVTVEREDEERPGHRLLVDFQWERQRLFDRAVVIACLELCTENPEAVITGIECREVTRTRPAPLNTVELTKLCSRKLRIDSHRCMQLAEALYNRGYISYPRTETERFTRTQDLLGLIEQQRDSPLWGQFAATLLDGGFEWPRDGPNDDAVASNGLAMDPMTMLEECENEDEWKLYEAVTRHFLACCSSDAIGFETKIEMNIAGEMFSTTGLIVLQKNYLEVYPYDSWASRRLPRFLLHERFIPNDVTIQAGSTQPPTLLTEADLIDKMDKERNYAVKTESQHFKPTDLGVALVKGYKLVGRICNADLSRPDLRANMERDMTLIARGAERKEDVIQRHVRTVAEVFRLLRVHIALLDEQLQRIFPPVAASDADSRVLQRGFCTCAKCGSSMDLMRWSFMSVLPSTPQDTGNEAQNTGSRTRNKPLPCYQRRKRADSQVPHRVPILFSDASTTRSSERTEWGTAMFLLLPSSESSFPVRGAISITIALL
ncbi:DNA topoisomerase III alpha, putative [Eimeria praecox]|uniref:DNA topoisomerase n=1 Tax=Eimeria praecox TaxID=51316 RepID=U6H4A3_9EIME|nr:DNA topoisomerase III alpha, putative [Eimeria praecox]